MTPLEVINKVIREEHGRRVTMTSYLKDSGLDSFGHTFVFLELDTAYGCFDNDWLDSIEDWSKVTIGDLVKRIQNESKELQEYYTWRERRGRKLRSK